MGQQTAQPRPQGLLLDDFQSRRSAILKIVEEKALGTRLQTALVDCFPWMGGWGTPLYQMSRPVRYQRLLFFSRFGHKWGIDFNRIGHLKGMVFAI